MTQYFYLKKVNDLFVFGKPRELKGIFNTIINGKNILLEINGIDDLDIKGEYFSDFSVVTDDLGFEETFIQSNGIDLKGYRAMDEELMISRFTINRNEEGELQEVVLIQEDGINKTEYLIYTEDSMYEMLDVLFDVRTILEVRAAVCDFMKTELKENTYYNIFGLVDHLMNTKEIYTLTELHVLLVIDEINDYLAKEVNSEETFQISNEYIDENGRLDYSHFNVVGNLNTNLLKGFHNSFN